MDRALSTAEGTPTQRVGIKACVAGRKVEDIQCPQSYLWLKPLVLAYYDGARRGLAYAEGAKHGHRIAPCGCDLSTHDPHRIQVRCELQPLRKPGHGERHQEASPCAIPTATADAIEQPVP